MAMVAHLYKCGTMLRGAFGGRRGHMRIPHRGFPAGDSRAG